MGLDIAISFDLWYNRDIFRIAVGHAPHRPFKCPSLSIQATLSPEQPQCAMCVSIITVE